MTKLIIHQKKLRGRDDSFFYDGLIAEKGKWEMYAVGEIAIYNKEAELVHNGWKEYGNGITIETDKDLTKIDDENYYWDMNNWFSIIHKKDDFEPEVYYSYKQAIKRLKQLPNN